MNDLDAYCERVGRGYVAMCRFSHKAQAWPLLEGGEPKLFASKIDALLAGYRHLIAHVNNSIRRDGERCVSNKKQGRKAAQMLFAKKRLPEAGSEAFDK